MTDKNSLLYKLFKIPRTIEEVVEKSNKTKEIPEVFLKRFRGSTLAPGSSIFNYKVGVKLGWFGFTLYGFKESLSNYVHGVDNPARLEKTDEFVKNIAYKLADELSNTNGCRVVKINGEFYNLLKLNQNAR